MKKTSIIAILLIALNSLSACSTFNNDKILLKEVAPTVISDITNDELKAIVDNQESSVIIVDTRKPEKYAEGHIPKAINMNAFTLTKNILNKTLPDKNAAYVLYCGGGKGATAIAQIMKQQGYTNVRTLGGINTHWKGKIVTD